ncbi:MAG: peroxiredoxin [Lentisphaerae bacterium]|nr:peroxiredoxin [Lentisphaerota bacterium]
MDAPGFEAVSTGGGKATLADYRGKWLVLYFYPKSFTTGCTKEACSLRDGHQKLADMGAAILGVSRDDLATQQKFKAEYQLPFELLADTDKAMAKAYGVIGFGGLYQRRTFLIDPAGKLAHIFYGVTVNIHDEEVVDELRKLQAEATEKP